MSRGASLAIFLISLKENMKIAFTQPALMRWILAAAVALGCHAALHAADTPVLRVGDQRQGTRGILEASGLLKDLPYRIEWSDFPAAQPLGEALNAGVIPRHLDVTPSFDTSFPLK